MRCCDQKHIVLYSIICMLTALLSTAAPHDSGVSVQAGRPVRSTLALVTLGEGALAGGCARMWPWVHNLLIAADVEY